MPNEVSPFQLGVVKDLLKGIDRERRVIMSELPGIRSLPPRQLSAPSGAYDDPKEQIIKSLEEIKGLVKSAIEKLP